MVSIIVPIYNSSRYLSRCIESILRQDYTDFELILVDDASTDNSRNIESVYEKKDIRVVCLHKAKNEGVDCARFSGLSIAKGKYILFVDSDDWLSSNNVLSKMVIAIENTKADYVETNVQRVIDKFGLVKKVYKPSVTGLIKQPELFDKYYLSFFGCNILSVNIWGKLYRKATIDKAMLSPSRLKMGEDLLFNLMLFPYLKSIYIINEVGYNYRFGGMTNRYNPTLLPDLKKLFIIKDDLAQKYNYEKAFNYLRIELKNVLRSDICQQIIFLNNSEDETINNISKELEDPVYQKISEVTGRPNFLTDPFVVGILNKDAITIYQLCKKIVDGEKWKRNLKWAASKILNYL